MEEHSGKHVQLLVRLLCAVGLLAVITAFAWSGILFWRVHVNRGKLEAIEVSLANASTVVNFTLEEGVRGALLALNDPEKKIDANNWRDTVNHKLKSLNIESNFSAPLFTDLQTLVVAITNLIDMTSRSQSSIAALGFDLNTRKQTILARDAISALRNAIVAAENQERLEQSQKSTMPRSTQQDHRVLALRSARNEIADLATLCEQISNEQDIEVLRDIKDNRIKLSIERLTRSLETLKNNSQPNSNTDLFPEGKLREVSWAIFGKNFSVDQANQTIQTSPDGLLAANYRALELVTERHQIESTAAALRSKVAILAANIQDEVSNHTRSVTENIDKSLSYSLGILAIGLFFLMSVLISLSIVILRTIRRQIVSLKESSHAAENAQRAMAQAQKLESIGQLAAGIAHEINTPMQYVGDNTRFVQKSFKKIDQFLEDIQELWSNSPEIKAAFAEKVKVAKIDYYRREFPKAVEQTLAGINTVVRIVKAMKEFSHPGAVWSEMNLETAMQSVGDVSRNEWKYVADLVIEIPSDLPPVPCYPGELNQVFLNLIVNGAHAIEDRPDKPEGYRGTLTIRAHVEGRHMVIEFTDTGCGIPERIRGKIFDPFFTTKKVGRGTGQGLAMAYQTIAHMHGGTLDFTSVVGEGTTFKIVLSLDYRPVGDTIATGEALQVTEKITEKKITDTTVQPGIH